MWIQHWLNQGSLRRWQQIQVAYVNTMNAMVERCTELKQRDLIFQARAAAMRLAQQGDLEALVQLPTRPLDDVLAEVRE